MDDEEGTGNQTRALLHGVDTKVAVGHAFPDRARSTTPHRHVLSLAGKCGRTHVQSFHDTWNLTGSVSAIHTSRSTGWRVGRLVIASCRVTRASPVAGNAPRHPLFIIRPADFPRFGCLGPRLAVGRM